MIHEYKVEGYTVISRQGLDRILIVLISFIYTRHFKKDINLSEVPVVSKPNSHSVQLLLTVQTNKSTFSSTL